MPCNDCSRTEQCPPKPLHKWKACSGCGHWQHSLRCMVMVEDTGDNCRCLTLTSALDIAKTCRDSGGCPEHPAFCTCGCPEGAHMGRPQGCIPHGFHGFACDHTRCGWKPREEPSPRLNLDPECKCHHPLTKHVEGLCLGCKDQDLGILSRHRFIGPEPEEEAYDYGEPECNCDPVRELDGYTYKSAYLHAAGCPSGRQPDEPPLTPEEEEMAPGYEELAREGRIRDAAERVATSSEGLNRRLEPYDGPPLPEEEEELTPRCDHCKRPGHSFEDCPEEEGAGKDATLLTDPDLQESLAQLRRGETEPALTREEEEESSDPDACDHQCQCEHDHWDHSSFGYCKQCDCGSSTGHYVTDCPEGPDDTDLSEEDVDRMMAEGEPVALEGPPCSEVEGCDGNCCAKAPPQPERRPPYLVAYSVQGHLYEVALPGDAAVRAVDGALVIQHHLGAVNGIVQVLPVINKES